MYHKFYTQLYIYGGTDDLEIGQLQLEITKLEASIKEVEEEVTQHKEFIRALHPKKQFTSDMLNDTRRRQKHCIPQMYEYEYDVSLTTSKPRSGHHQSQ